MQSKLDRIKEILKEKLNEGLSTDKELENLINNQIKNNHLTNNDIEYLLDDEYICDCNGLDSNIIRTTLQKNLKN